MKTRRRSPSRRETLALLVKWIRCAVGEMDRRAFSEAQSKWSVIAGSPGFVGQHGGWDIRANSPTACIVCVWQDIDSYRSFMGMLHDKITDANQQARTYSEIHVDHCDVVFAMPGAHEGLIEGIASGGSFLRVAECTVKADRVESFLQVQRDIWVPAMASTPGMHGGLFLRSHTNPVSFTVLTSWTSILEHDDYAKNRVPELRRRADVTADLEKLVGRFIPLEPRWSVAKIAE